MAEKEYIEREAAIEKFKGSNESKFYQFEAVNRLRSIPADVRPVKRGKWALNKDGSGTCSECGFIQNSCWDLDNWDNFCHHCGADMRQEPT